ncbi:hypothetical protein [Streptomyces sp. NBC_00859]|uniref:hypothetical protein n=1 Tax=Streptomyces sp. NBC_00859 TaxID=2903682 RepID=UPI00386657C7|nr:hypothetical protein OG584_17940 [Streptomyces sp. NBC_00859]
MLVRHLLRASAASLALASTLLTAGGAQAVGAPSDWEVSLSGHSPAGSLMSVSSVSDDLAWAVGRGDSGGVIMRWNGEKWNEDTAPGLPDVWQWSSVTAVSEDDVWAYGSVGMDQRLAHYDGERWTSVPTTGPADDSWPEVPIKAVPGRLFKGGDALYTYSDGTWKTFALPSLVDIRDIDALSANDAYATGMQYPVDGGHSVTYHWDGTTWTLMDEAPVRAGTETAKVVAESPTSVYVAGWAEGAHGDPPAPSVEHWNGTAWEDVTGALADLYLEAIVSDGHGGLWATGNDQADPAHAESVFWHFDGTTWTRKAGAPAPDGDTTWPSYSFYDLAPVGSTGGFWAVGDYSTPLNADGDRPVYGLIEQSTTAPGAAAATSSR